MVGNDIVDIKLAKAQSNWQRPRYLDKLFTNQEQKLILSAYEPTIMVWTLWSMKEAAYKLYTQINPGRFYNPKAFECFYEARPVVKYKTFACNVNIKATSDYILSEVRLVGDKMTSKVFDLEYTNHSTQSLLVKKTALELFAGAFNCRLNDIDLTKSEFDIPFISHNSQRYHLSISHHGKYGAVAIV